MNYKRILSKIAHKEFVQNRNDFLTSFRANQVSSKTWLVDNLVAAMGAGTNITNVAVLGSWNSVLLYELLSDVMTIDHWHFYDVNEKVHQDRDMYFSANKMHKNYTSYTKNVNSLFGKGADPAFHRLYDLIINPSSEHMDDLHTTWGPIYALMSNNYTHLDDGQHINCCTSSLDLKNKNNISKARIKGTLGLGGYDRYLVIGQH
jgi:hypothetical protein